MRPHGFSSGAFDYLSRQPGIEVVRRHGLTAVELSAFSESELRGVEDDLRAGVEGLVLGVHAPVRDLELGEEELVARLDGLGLPVVLHPYVMKDPTLWRALGSRLRVENSDGRKSTGQDASSLSEVFTLFPEAGMCLDVSHALHAGGRELLDELVGEHGARVRQLHLGCSCGEAVTRTFEPELVEAAAAVLPGLAPDVTLVAERVVDPLDEATIVSQARDLRMLAEV